MASNTHTKQIPSNELLQTLIDKSIESRLKAFAPYSKFLVGAAILGQNDKIYTGGNIENQSYGLTICAERTAACAMVNDGCHGIKCVVVATNIGTSPCGACRQFLFEFRTQDNGGDFPIYLINSDTREIALETSMQKLLPHGCDIVTTLHDLANQN